MITGPPRRVVLDCSLRGVSRYTIVDQGIDEENVMKKENTRDVYKVNQAYIIRCELEILIYPEAEA